MSESLGEAYPKEQARMRTVLGHYKEIGPEGQFGATMIEDVLRRADEAAVAGDLAQMIRRFQEMKGVSE